MQQRKTPSDSTVQFFKWASKPKSLFISVCSNDSASGCLNACKLLQAHFPQTQLVSAYSSASDNNHGFKFNQDELPKETHAVFILGCISGLSQFLVGQLKNQYKFTSLEAVFILPSVNQGLFEFFPRVMAAKQISADFKVAAHAVDFGANHDFTYNIGMPAIPKFLDSKQSIHPDCFGLLFANVAVGFFHQTEDKKIRQQARKFFTEYFKRVRNAAKDCNSHPQVLFICDNIFYPSHIKKIPEISDLFSQIAKIASHKGVKLELIKERLPQDGFLKTIQLLKEKNGIVACDGAMTLIQSLSLGALPFFFFIEKNAGICEFLFSKLRGKAQQTAGLCFLGKNIYDSVEMNEIDIAYTETCMEMFWGKAVVCLQNEIKTANEKFAQLKSSLADEKPSKPLQVIEPQTLPEKKPAGQTPLFQKSFGDNICRLLKERTHVDWFCQKAADNKLEYAESAYIPESDIPTMMMHLAKLKHIGAVKDANGYKIKISQAGLDSTLIKLIPVMVVLAKPELS